MLVLLALSLIILLIIISIIFAPLVTPNSINLDLPVLGQYEDVPLIVVILTSMFIGVVISFVVMILKEVIRSMGSWRMNRRQRQREAVEELYNQGLNLMSAGRTADAMVNFNKVVSRDQQFVYAYVSLGDIYFSEGNYDRAIEYHSRAHLLKKESIDILVKQEKDFEHAKRPAEGISILKKIIELDNTNIYAFIKIRQLYLQLENWKEALEVQKQVLSLTKPGPQKKIEQKCLVGILYEIAGLVLQDGDPAESIKQYREIIKSNKDYIPAYVKLSEAHLASGDHEEAIRVLEKANRQFPSYLYFPRLEELYMNKENPSAIIEAYREAIRRSPQEIRLNFLLGKLYMKLEMLDEALGQFQEVLSKDSESPLLHKMIGELHERFHRYHEASEEYKKAIPAPADGTEVLYVCSTCKNQAASWMDRCPRCNNWNTFQLNL